VFIETFLQTDRQTDRQTQCTDDIFCVQKVSSFSTIHAYYIMPTVDTVSLNMLRIHK